MKSFGSTGKVPWVLLVSREVGVCGTSGGAVKCVDNRRNAGAKATNWTSSDAEARKLGEQTGLDTPVVLALNDGY